MSQSYLQIPEVEKLVPFPNFATVLLQHAREFPEKIALDFEDQKYSYEALAEMCFSVELAKEPIIITFSKTENDLLLFLTCLFQGREFNLDLEANTSAKLPKIKTKAEELAYFDPPYVKLDDAALSLNNKYHFTQYHVLLAAQAIGKALKLFREGTVYCSREIDSVSDLVFGVLAPIYYCKTIEFYYSDKKDHYQYGWDKEIDSNLRDAVSVYYKNEDGGGISLLESFDHAMGIGPLQTPDGKILELLGYEFEKINGEWNVTGHGVVR